MKNEKTVEEKVVLVAEESVQEEVLAVGDIPAETLEETLEENEYTGPAMVQKRKAIAVGFVGAIGAGAAGFFGGMVFKASENRKLLNTIREGISNISNATIATEKIDGDIEAMRNQVEEILAKAKLSKKDREVWNNLLLELIDLTGIYAANEFEGKILKVENKQ